MKQHSTQTKLGVVFLMIMSGFMIGRIVYVAQKAWWEDASRTKANQHGWDYSR